MGWSRDPEALAPVLDTYEPARCDDCGATTDNWSVDERDGKVLFPSCMFEG